jgi:Protein of unknown function (DUF4019)
MRTVRRVLRALAVLAVASGLGMDAVHAQDAATSVVQAAARDWLVLADKGDAGATYDAAGAQFKQAMTPERWGDALVSVRKPLGALQRRTMTATTFRTTAPGAPPEDFALVRFRTEFAAKADARETVTLQREPDDRWRVVGYKLQ